MHAIGYSITTGADFIDYLLTDRTYIPEAWESVGPEKLLYMPGTFMPTKRPEQIGPAVRWAAQGLPDEAVVFCNFNHPCKFEPRIFAAWMTILANVPGSVLRFGAWINDTRANLRREAAKHGIDGYRLIFAEIVDQEDHLARLSLVDLALDNLQHGGGVTSVDALWVGLPVLTILGDKPGARLGATLCNAAGVPDMITSNLPSYINRAVALAADPALRHALRGDPTTVITTDTVRAGAAAQLSGYTDILQQPLLTVETPENLHAAILNHAGSRILIDTPSANPFNADKMSDLGRFIAVADVDPVLVVPAGLNAQDAGDMAAVFARLGWNTFIATQLDGARRLGAILAAAHGGSLAFSGVSISSSIASGLTSLSPMSLASVLLRDPEENHQYAQSGVNQA